MGLRTPPIQQNAVKTLDISFEAKLKLSKVNIKMINSNRKHFKSIMQNKSTIGVFATHPPTQSLLLVDYRKV